MDFKIPEWVERFLEWITDAFDKGWYFYLILGLLFIIAILLFTALMLGFTKKPEEIPLQQLEVMDYAPSFCNELGYTGWKWVNITKSYNFTCYNVTENKPNLLDRFVG